jgi:hypothetical protein
MSKALGLFMAWAPCFTPVALEEILFSLGCPLESYVEVEVDFQAGCATSVTVSGGVLASETAACFVRGLSGHRFACAEGLYCGKAAGPDLACP